MSRPQRVAIVDYGMCNLDSVRRAFEEVGARPFVTDDPADLDAADRIVLPGVGAFPDAMRNLRARGLDEALAKQVLPRGRAVPRRVPRHAADGRDRRRGRGDRRDSVGSTPGSCASCRPTDPRVPHVGWNEVTPVDESPLFDGIPPGADFYFVHSFHVACATATCWRPRRTAAGSRRPCSAGTRSACSSTPRRASSGACACWPTSSTV